MSDYNDKLRSNKSTKQFQKLDDKNNPVNVDESQLFTGTDSQLPDLSHLTDPQDQAEAYKELSEKLYKLLEEERQSHLDFSKENNNFIKVQEEDIRALEIETQVLNEQLANTKALLEEVNNKINMELEAKDIIIGIPVFSGELKQLDAFINTCGVYYNMVTEAQKPDALRIIKAKITGEALAKAGPFGNDLNTWDLLKNRLKDRIKKPVSLEYANEDLNKVFQKKDETIEDYGARVKTKLKKLNEASRSLTNIAAEMTILRKANEKQAISKFEQNIRNATIKVLVSAAGKDTLDECISFAMQKELIEGNKNIKTCGFCGLANHDESSCRKKKNNNGNNDQKRFGQRKGNGNGTGYNHNNNSNNWKYRSNFNSQNNSQGNSQNEEGKKSPAKNEKPPFNRFSQSRNNGESWKNRSDGDKGQKNVRTTQQDSSDDEISVEDAIRLTESSKN